MSIGAKIHSYTPGGALGVAVVDPVTGNATTVTSINGTVVASVVGQLTVTASLIGNVAVTQVTSPWIVQAASTGFAPAIVGSVGATQLGAPWSFVGSVQVTQASSPWIVQQGSSGQNIFVIVTSIQGAGLSVTGSVGATQLGAPWSVIGSQQIQGQAAHDAAAVGNPVLGAGFATGSADTSVVVSGDVARLRTTLDGRLLVGYAPPEDFVSFATGPVTVGSTFTPLLNAAGAGLRNYITDINVSVSSIGTIFNLLDGSAVVYTTFVDPQGGDTNVSFRTPIRGTANSSLACQFVDSGANASVFVSGYKAS